MATAYFRTYILDVQGRWPISTLTMMMYKGDGSFPQFKTRSVDFGHRPESRGDDQFPHFKRRSVDLGRRPPIWGRRPISTLQKENCGFWLSPQIGATTCFHTSKGEVWNFKCAFRGMLGQKGSHRELWVFECRPDVVDPADHVNAVYVAHRRRGRSCQCCVLCTCPTTPI